MGRLHFLRPSNCHNAEKGRPRGTAVLGKISHAGLWKWQKKSQKPTDKQQSGQREMVMNVNFYFSSKYSHGVCSIIVSIDSTSNQLPYSQSATCCEIMCFFCFFFFFHKNDLIYVSGWSQFQFPKLYQTCCPHFHFISFLVFWFSVSLPRIS